MQIIYRAQNCTIMLGKDTLIMDMLNGVQLNEWSCMLLCEKQEAPILGSIIIPLIKTNLIDIIVLPKNKLLLFSESSHLI